MEELSSGSIVAKVIRHTSSDVSRLTPGILLENLSFLLEIL